MNNATSTPAANQDKNPPTSRYKGEKYYQRTIPGVGSFVEPQIWRAPYIPVSPKDLYTTVDPGEVGRLDLIAARVYRIESLWWVIGLANNIIDPLEEVTAGRSLRYPDFSWVAANILS